MSSTPLHRLDSDAGPSNVVPLARAPVPDGPRQIDISGIGRRTLGRRWIVISLLCHLLMIGVLVFGLVEAPQPVPPPVLKITLVERGPGGEGAAGGTGGSTDREAGAAAPAPSTPDIPPPAPEPIAPPTPPQPEMPPPEPPQPEIPKPTPPSPETPPPTPTPTRQPPPQTPPTPRPPNPMAMMPRPVVLEPPPPPKPRHVPPRAHPATHRRPPRALVAAPPAPNPVPAPSPAPAATPAPAQTQTATELATPGAGGPGAEARPGKGAVGAGKGAIGTGVGPGDDYLERLYRHLLRYKKYPPEAIGAKQQGSVTVAFTIARDGTVSDVKIEKSSGSAMLDDATLALVRRASPVPALPDSYKGNLARVKFPIDYKLSLLDQMF